jgi:DNA-binding transcriptional regulator YbjK
MLRDKLSAAKAQQRADEYLKTETSPEREELAKAIDTALKNRAEKTRTSTRKSNSKALAEGKAHLRAVPAEPEDADPIALAYTQFSQDLIEISKNKNASPELVNSAIDQLRVLEEQLRKMLGP